MSAPACLGKPSKLAKLGRHAADRSFRISAPILQRGAVGPDVVVLSVAKAAKRDQDFDLHFRQSVIRAHFHWHHGEGAGHRSPARLDDPARLLQILALQPVHPHADTSEAARYGLPVPAEADTMALLKS